MDAKKQNRPTGLSFDTNWTAPQEKAQLVILRKYHFRSQGVLLRSYSNRNQIITLYAPSYELIWNNTWLIISP